MIVYPAALLKHFETKRGLALFGTCEIARDFICWTLQQQNKKADWVNVEADTLVQDPTPYLEKGLFADAEKRRFVSVSGIKDRHVGFLKDLHKEGAEDCFLYCGPNIKKSSSLVRWASQSPEIGALACYSNTHLPLKKAIYSASLKWLPLEVEQTILSKIYDSVPLEAWPDIREKLFLLSSETGFSASVYLESAVHDFSDARNWFMEKKRQRLLSFFRRTLSNQDGLSLMRALTYSLSQILLLMRACERGSSFDQAFLALKFPPFSDKALYQRALRLWSVRSIERALTAVGQAELILKQGNPFWFFPLTRSFS